MSLKVVNGSIHRECDICGRKFYGPYSVIDEKFVNIDEFDFKAEPDYEAVIDIRRDEICPDCMDTIKHFVTTLRSEERRK